MIKFGNFLLFSSLYCSQFFLTKLLTLGILFSTSVRAVVVVAKLEMLGILPFTLFILTLRVVLVATKPVNIGPQDVPTLSPSNVPRTSHKHPI